MRVWNRAGALLAAGALLLGGEEGAEEEGAEEQPAKAATAMMRARVKASFFMCVTP